jgi:hypothetical protein
VFLFENLLSGSTGTDGHSWLPDDTKGWLAGLKPHLPRQLWIHQDAAARQASRILVRVEPEDASIDWGGDRGLFPKSLRPFFVKSVGLFQRSLI